MGYVLVISSPEILELNQRMYHHRGHCNEPKIQDEILKKFLSTVLIFNFVNLPRN